MTFEIDRPCRTCKYLIGIRHNESQWADWQCGHEQSKRDINPVLGRYIYHTCGVARAQITLCGMNGTLWEEYVPPESPVLIPLKEQRKSLADTL